MIRRISAPVVVILLLVSRAAVAAETSPATCVRGFQGEPQGGMQVRWYTHLGMTTLYGVRQRKGITEMQWKSARCRRKSRPRPSLSSGRGRWAHGSRRRLYDPRQRPCGRGVRRGAGADAVPCRDQRCRLLYDVLYTLNTDSSGHFYLTVPKAAKAGQAAVLAVKATDRKAQRKPRTLLARSVAASFLFLLLPFQSQYRAGDLIKAAQRGDVAGIESCLASGADVNEVDASMCTALTLAAQSGATAVVKLLIRGRADLDIRDLAGNTPLIAAAGFSHKDVTGLLRP